MSPANPFIPAAPGWQQCFVCAIVMLFRAHVGVGERLSDGLTLAGFMCPPLCFLSSLIFPSGVLLLC